MTRIPRFWPGLVLLALAAPAAAQAPLSSYAVADSIRLEGDGGWDYITCDAAAGRLYVSHGAQVQVVDTKTRRQIGAIPDTRGVHGIALAPDLDQGFTSNGRDTTVTVFRLSDLAVIARVKVTGANPDAIFYDSASHRVFTFNGGGANATAIDARADTVAGTVALDGKPEFPAGAGDGRIFVNIEDQDEIEAIDAATLTVLYKWPIAPGRQPTGLAYDGKHRRLFSVCRSQLMVVSDAAGGKAIAHLAIGARADGAAYDPGLNRAFSSNGEGTVTVVQEVGPDSFAATATVPTRPGARTMALDAKTHRLYLPAAELLPAPDSSAAGPRARPRTKPGTFKVLELAPQ